MKYCNLLEFAKCFYIYKRMSCVAWDCICNFHSKSVIILISGFFSIKPQITFAEKIINFQQEKEEYLIIHPQSEKGLKSAVVNQTYNP